MTSDTLKIIDGKMAELEIPYAFLRWTKPPPEMYFVGEYQETEGSTKEENGLQETVFILTGFTNGSWDLLIEAKEKIESVLPWTDNNGKQAVAVFYGSAMAVPTGAADLKRIQINLIIKEWKGGSL